jgi:GT2 family glycosyltransferase
MVETFSIASVTVAYNGVKVLPSHLDGLKEQSRELDEIIIVDNASTDTTSELLKAKYPKVTVLNQPENGGVGGGFAVGLAYAAIQKQYDWIWLFDQDSVPKPDALEVLLSALQRLENAASTAILAPVGVNEESDLAYSGHVWRNGLRPVTGKPAEHEICFVDAVISSGTLIRREAVEKIGLPRADFFMDFVDYEYCLRLRHQGYTIAVVPASRIDHAIGNPLKVTAFGLHKVWTSHPPWREYYMTRNQIFTVWNYCPDWKARSATMLQLLSHSIALLLFGKRKLACLKMIFRGVSDGLSGRLGIRPFGDQQMRRCSATACSE